jgi:FAD/FMN-containing dehydrogenase
LLLQLEESDIAQFRTIMAPERVQTEQDVCLSLCFLLAHRRVMVVIVPQVLDAHNMDWLRKYRGNSQLVLKPKTVGEVSAALKYCHDQR